MAFSSDDELIEALGHVADNGDGVFRVYAEELDDQQLPPANQGRVSDVGVFPPANLLSKVSAACGQLIDGLLPAPSQQQCDDRRQVAEGVNPGAQTPAADGSSCCGGAAADGSRCAATEGTDAAGSTTHQPAALSCLSSHLVDEGNKAAEKVLANVVDGVNAMLSPFKGKRVFHNL